MIAKSESMIKRKIWLWLSISINLGFLFFFKYYNFFSQSLVESLSSINIKIDLFTLNLILPVGISFYTFHGLSYIIDIYKRKINPEYDFIVYAVFVSFFPLLVAGPIERATHLLPQIKRTRKFEYLIASDGLKQILWGFFKKIVIADTCATYVNTIFIHDSNYSGSTNLLGALFFAIQIYCDFSGYSDIAIGIAKLFGIQLIRNFAFPYFSRDIAEFWRRWHISLSSWFKDYLYIPLGGSKVGPGRATINTLIVFIVSGLWHGANWTFIIWGFLNALYILPLIWMKRNRTYLDIVSHDKILPSFKEAFQILLTFTLTVFAWIFFRSENVKFAFTFIYKILSTSLLSIPYFPGIGLTAPLFIFILVLIVMEWNSRSKNHALENFGKNLHRYFRWLVYTCLILISFYYSFVNIDKNFIYFQF